MNDIDPLHSNGVRKLRWHFGWEFETTHQHFKEHPPTVGDHVLVVSTQGGIVTYELATVTNLTNRTINLGKQFGWAGPSFYYSGKNHYSPTGQTRMIPLSMEMLKYFETSKTSRIMISYAYSEVEINDFLESVNA